MSDFFMLNQARIIRETCCIFQKYNWRIEDQGQVAAESTQISL